MYRNNRFTRLTTAIILLFVSMCDVTVPLVSASSVTAAEQPVLSFAVMSDIHIHKNNTEVHRRLTSALRDYGQINPQLDLIAINGDLTNGFPSHYDVLRRLLAETPHPPLHFTNGNHDFNKMLYNGDGKKDLKHLPNGWSSEKALALFKAFTGYDQPYHDVWVKGYHFIFLANEKSRDHSRTIGKHGYLSKQQLGWLQEKLAEQRDGGRNPKFVFFHQPLPNTLSGSQKDVNIIQHGALRQILKQYPEVIFFSGHTHYNLRKTEQMHFDTFLMLGSSSIMRHQESLYVEVYDDYINIHSRDHHLREWISGKSYRYRTKPRLSFR